MPSSFASPEQVIGLTVGAMVLAILLLAFAFAKRYRKVGPNQALIISGRGGVYRTADGRMERRGFRIVRGGGTFVWPVIETAQVLSLELMTIDMQTQGRTAESLPVRVDSAVQVKVGGEYDAIATAAEWFLSKNPDEVRQVVQQMIERHIHVALGAVTGEQVDENRDALARQVQENAAGDLAQMGLTIVSLTIRDIR